MFSDKNDLENYFKITDLDDEQDLRNRGSGRRSAEDRVPNRNRNSRNMEISICYTRS